MARFGVRARTNMRHVNLSRGGPSKNSSHQGPDSQFLWEAGVRQGMRVLVVAVDGEETPAPGQACIAEHPGQPLLCDPVCLGDVRNLVTSGTALVGMSLALWAVFFIASMLAPVCYFQAPVPFLPPWFYQLLLCLGWIVHRKTYKKTQIRAWRPNRHDEGTDQPSEHRIVGDNLTCCVQLSFSSAIWGALLLMATSSCTPAHLAEGFRGGFGPDGPDVGSSHCSYCLFQGHRSAASPWWT